MRNEKKESPVKKFSLDDFKTQAKTISSGELLESITGGVEDNCHVHTPGVWCPPCKTKGGLDLPPNP
jgi:hypothetical protein